MRADRDDALALSGPAAGRLGSTGGTLARPAHSYALPALLLTFLVPLYWIVGLLTEGRTLYVPEVALDRFIGVQPRWGIVYGSLYVFAFLPLFVVRQKALLRRTILAYITAVIVAYVGFVVYPAAAPRPAAVLGGDFFSWSVRLIYRLDTPYNCFPSLHVAYSFLAALTCYRVHRGVGLIAVAWATLIGVSTLYIKQHYAVDVLAGILLAYLGYVAFLRSYPRELVDEADRRRAPLRALGAVGSFGLMIGCFVIAYAGGV